MVILDTNIWYAHLSEEDFRHDKAEKIFESLQDDILIPEYILLELCTLLARNKKKEIADRFIGMAEDNDRTELLPSSSLFFKEVREAFREIESHRLSFVDVALLLFSRSYTVMTFDQALYKLLKKKSL